MQQKCRIDDGGRECARCHEYQAWEFYGKDTVRRPYARTPRCRKCTGEVSKLRRKLYKNLPV